MTGVGLGFGVGSWRRMMSDGLRALSSLGVCAARRGRFPKLFPVKDLMGFLLLPRKNMPASTAVCASSSPPPFGSLLPFVWLPVEGPGSISSPVLGTGQPCEPSLLSAKILSRLVRFAPCLGMLPGSHPWAGSKSCYLPSRIWLLCASELLLYFSARRRGD